MKFELRKKRGERKKCYHTEGPWWWGGSVLYASRANKKCVFAFFSFSSLLPHLWHCHPGPSSLRALLNIKRVVCWFFYKNKANKNIKKDETPTKKKKHRFRRSTANKINT